MQVRRVAGALGAEITGVDLRDPDLDFDQRRIIRRLEIDGDRPYFDPNGS